MDGFEFSMAMQSLLIPKGKYICDTGSYKNVNEILYKRLKKNIEKHPLIWKIFFSVV